MIVDVVFGFLGSGKTTFISRILRDWGAGEKIVVLVNEFGEVGIDGTLLAGGGGNVVEMPSGCICCTLQADFRSQMLEINRSIRPERVIIEPTGVATIAQIRSIIGAQLFEDAIEEVHHIMIADATGFMGLYKANRHFVESQVKNADLVLLNKCDRVEKRKAVLTQNAISAINPETAVLMTEFGAVDWGEYRLALASGSGRPELRHAGRKVAVPGSAHVTPLLEKGEFHPHVEEDKDALGYESFGCVYGDLTFDQRALESLFQALAAQDPGMGEIVRAKGIFRTRGGWILMGLASGEFSSQPIKESMENKVSIIGKDLNREKIGAALERCVFVRDE
jgi:G3E family GTPase